MQTTSDLFSFSFLVRLKAGGSPESGDNLLSLTPGYHFGHAGLVMEDSGSG